MTNAITARHPANRCSSTAKPSRRWGEMNMWRSPLQVLTHAAKRPASSLLPPRCAESKAMLADNAASGLLLVTHSTTDSSTPNRTVNQETCAGAPSSCLGHERHVAAYKWAGCCRQQTDDTWDAHGHVHQHAVHSRPVVTPFNSNHIIQQFLISVAVFEAKVCRHSASHFSLR
jgi:hypothetical protein